MAKMLEAQERTIGGRLWTVSLLPATKGLDVYRRLVKLLGPALAAALGSLHAASVLDGEIDMGRLGSAFGTLAERLGDPDAASLVKELVTSNLHCDGVEVTPKTFDLLFQGDYTTLFQVAAFVIEANFALPFASWAAAIQERATRPKKPPTPEPLTS